MKDHLMKIKTIMVIEDNEKSMDLFRILLKKGKYKVLEASEAEAGIAMALKHKPNLILMDIQLPGMDGLSAVRILKDHPDLKKIPIVGLSSYAMDGDIRRALAAGCDGYITKPVDTRTFLKTIGEYVKNIRNDGQNRKENDPEKKVREEKDLVYKSRILIVDNEPLDVKLLAAILPDDRCETIKAYSGEEALQKISEELPDLILLDIMMPGMDGLEVCRRLKEDPKTSSIPIILISMLDDLTAKSKGLKAGAQEVLSKPVNAMKLREKVQCLLEGREPVMIKNSVTKKGGHNEG
jgi:two-component system cell cycle response regulator